ncbi:MAG TPA: hypothetical protein PKY50_13520 [Candidatus Competibacter sp.]|nr:hypothetical protein [Candidatus Competibacter sp.]
MSDELFQALLRELFEGDDDRLCEMLRPLTAGQRKALFEQFGELLKVLNRACRYEPAARPTKLAGLYRAIREDPVEFLRDRATSLAAPGALNNPQALQGGLLQQRAYGALMAFYSRLNLLLAGLAGKGGVTGAFKTSSRQPVRTQKFVLYAGRVLLDRPEPWIGEALARAFEHLQNRARFTGGDQGVARLMLEARQQRPEWADMLAPYIGMAMRRDGFFSHALEGFDSAMILAGLDYDPPAQEVFFEPLLNPRVVDTLIRRLAEGSLPRAGLLALIVRKLQSPLRPGIAKCWIGLFDRLAPTGAEIRVHAGEWMTLLNAPAPAASKLAFGIVEQHFLEEADRTELAGALGYALQSPVQALAKSALRLLKKQVKAKPELLESVLNAVVNGLSSPHAALRAGLLRWLGSFQPQHFDEETLRLLQETVTMLPPAELAPIAHLLAERPATSPDGMEAENPDRHPDLLAAVAVLRHRAEADPADTLSRRRLAFLEHYLATGQCGELAATVPDHSSALSPPGFALHETAEALALDIARTRDRIFTQADYDRILASALRFAKQARTERVNAILAPVLEKLGEWQQKSLEGSAWWGRGGELPALFLARTWRGEALPDFPKNSRGGQLLDSQLKPAQRRRLRYVSTLIAAGQGTLLSVPTHAAGWLAPAVFAGRFSALPPHLLDADELGAALYRLPMLPERRADAWNRLAPVIAQLDAPFADALILALAPAAGAEAALERWLRCFEKRPPTEPLCHAPSSGFAGGGLVDAVRVKVFHHDPNAAENVAFRLFGAALRCRFGLDDAGIAGRAPRLLERLSSARGWFNRMFHESQLKSALLTELLFAPQLVTDALVEQLHANFPSYLGQDTSHPVLWPYLLTDTRYFAMPNLIADQAFRFPPLAQRLFEAGLYRQGRKEDFYRDVTLGLVMQGKSPQVDIRPHLDRMTRGLSAAQTPQREGCVDVLAQGLRDGRVTPSDLAGALAGRIGSTEQGFAQLDQALASLCATGEAGRVAVWRALEQVIGDGVAAFSPRKLSLVLDRLTGIVDEMRQGVHDSVARRELEQLAAAKKKSVARDKASALVARSGGAGQPPPQILAVAALAAE